ncbi:hypothetical protein O0I10_005712 [Lichtheimia ornata]|uniref:Uncharacterized protein n=1 Tax=Lichtheimia ornata TaxID=688661 RepID=A0AAD7Y1J2_9FUNG|nr:uncharacterized protein O0I10_005712 [Lichtheimia ornata]KAJ8658672.1 hypothetical protein O0I10_005712 [Lichtheimia ornata]
MLTTKACGLVLLVISHCVYGRLNMLDDGTSGSDKRNLLINEPYSETAARQHGWHGDTVFICDKNAIEQHHKDVIVLYFPVELYMLCPGTVRLMLRPQGFKNASSVRTAPSFYGY